MKYRERTQLIEADEWRITTRGSHRQYRHPVKKGRVTIAGKPNQDVGPSMRKSILKQAGLDQ